MVTSLNVPLLQHKAPSLLGELRVYLERHQAALVRMLDCPEQGGTALSCRHAKVMDGLLTALYPAACACLRDRGRDSSVLLAAVGSYGHGLLGLRSGLRLGIFTTHASDRQAGSIAEALLGPLTEAGVCIVHRVLSVGDAVSLAGRDLDAATGLLDLRPLAGDMGVAEALHERAFESLFREPERARFFARLAEEVRDRHRHSGDAAHMLEPDIRRGIGGLRDMHAAFWIARVRFGARTLRSLVDSHLLSAEQAQEAGTAHEFLWRVRNHLHRQSDTGSDQLTFEFQKRVARAMGYKAQSACCGAQRTRPSPEAALIRDYRKHTECVARVRELLWDRAVAP